MDGLTDLNRPSRADWYAVRIVQEIRGLFASVPRGYGKVVFEPPLDPTTLPDWFPKPMTKETIEATHRRWRRDGIMA